MFEFEYCLLFKGKNVFKLSNLIEDEVVLNVDQDGLATILFIIKMKITTRNPMNLDSNQILSSIY